MGFLSRFRHGEASIEDKGYKSAHAQGRTITPRYGDSGFTRPLMWSAYLKTAPLNAAINTIAETAISKGFLFEDQAKGAPLSQSQKILRDKAEALLNSPGGLLTGSEFLKGIILSLEIFGDAWVEVQYKVLKNLNGQVIGREPFKLWLLPPQQMTIIQDPKSGDIIGYKQQPGNGQQNIDFEPGDVIHIALNPGPGAHYGTPPMVAAKALIATWLRAIEYNHDYYFNHGRPKALINLGDVPNPAIERLINQIKSDMDSEAGGYTFINTPQMTVAPLSDSNKDMEFNALLRYMETRILSIYKVPQIKIGISETGGAGMITGTTQISAFYDSIDALNALLEAAFNRFFKERLGLTRYKFKIRSPRPLIDPSLISAYGLLLDKQALTPNELRDVIGLPPLPNGDKTITPAATAPALFSQAEPQQSLLNKKALGGTLTPRADTVGGAGTESATGDNITPHTFNTPGGIYNAAQDIAHQNAEQLKGDIIAGIRALYRRTLGDSQRSEHKVINPDTFKGEVQGIIDKATGALIEQSATQSIDLWLEGEASISGTPPDPDALPKDLLDSINQDLGIKPIKTFSADLADQINDLIDSTIAEGGISLYKLTSTIEDNIPEVLESEQWKLERIERTRFNHIANRARVNSMQRMGTKAYKRIGVRDSRQSDICRALDGKIFNISDTRYLPPSHPNCRCITAPLTDSEYNKALEAGLIVGSEEVV